MHSITGPGSVTNHVAPPHTCAAHRATGSSSAASTTTIVAVLRRALRRVAHGTSRPTSGASRGSGSKRSNTRAATTRPTDMPATKAIVTSPSTSPTAATAAASPTQAHPLGHDGRELAVRAVARRGRRTVSRAQPGPATTASRPTYPNVHRAARLATRSRLVRQCRPAPGSGSRCRRGTGSDSPRRAARSGPAGPAARGERNSTAQSSGSTSGRTSVHRVPRRAAASTWSALTSKVGATFEVSGAATTSSTTRRR